MQENNSMHLKKPKALSMSMRVFGLSKDSDQSSKKSDQSPQNQKKRETGYFGNISHQEIKSQNLDLAAKGLIIESKAQPCNIIYQDYKNFTPNESKAFETKYNNFVKKSKKIEQKIAQREIKKQKIVLKQGSLKVAQDQQIQDKQLQNFNSIFEVNPRMKDVIKRQGSEKKSKSSIPIGKNLDEIQIQKKLVQRIIQKSKTLTQKMDKATLTIISNKKKKCHIFSKVSQFEILDDQKIQSEVFDWIDQFYNSNQQLQAIILATQLLSFCLKSQFLILLSGFFTQIFLLYDSRIQYEDLNKLKNKKRSKNTFELVFQTSVYPPEKKEVKIETTKNEADPSGSVTSEDHSVISRMPHNLSNKPPSLVSRNERRKNASREVILKHLSSVVLLCKMQRLQRLGQQRQSEYNVNCKEHIVSKPRVNQSMDIDSQNILDNRPNKTQDYSLKKIIPKKRKLKISLIEASDNFFKKFPLNEHLDQENLSMKMMDLTYKRKMNSQAFDQNNSSTFRILNQYSLKNKSGGDVSRSHHSSSSLKGGNMLPSGKNSLFKCTDESQSERRSHDFNRRSIFGDDEAISGFSDVEQGLMEMKIYLPYFISYATVIQYQNPKNQDTMPDKLSIIDILQTHFLQNKSMSRLFFKVNLSDESKQQEYEKETLTSNEFHAMSKHGTDMEEIKETVSDNTDKNSSSNNKEERKMHKFKRTAYGAKSKNSQSIVVQAGLSNSSNDVEEKSDSGESNLDSENSKKTDQYYDCNENNENNEDQIRYYEFEIKQIDQFDDGVTREKNITYLNIKDITTLIKNQQKTSDMIYQDAIENNYSHEQMTPLNPIMNYSTILKQLLIQLYAQKLNIASVPNSIKDIERVNCNTLNQIVTRYQEAKFSLQQMISIEQSAKAIWFYNSNQIKRMKIKKNQLQIDPYPIKTIIPTLWNVIWPFEHYIVRRRVNLYLITSLFDNHEVITDWKLYEGVLFNLMQNALKYNKPVDGDIILTLTCKPMKRQKKSNEKLYVLETQIIDSGVGISPDRQNLLFIPFLELKDRVGIVKSQNDNIGLGLACSKSICNKLGGDLKLKMSKAGITVFGFKIPVKLQSLQDQASDNVLSVKLNHQKSGIVRQTLTNKVNEHIKLIGNEREMHPQISDYLKLNLFIKNDDEYYSSGSESSQSQRTFKKKGVQITLQPLFREILYFPNQKIGFNILENVGKYTNREKGDSKLSYLSERNINLSIQEKKPKIAQNVTVSEKLNNQSLYNFQMRRHSQIYNIHSFQLQYKEDQALGQSLKNNSDLKSEPEKDMFHPIKPSSSIANIHSCLEQSKYSKRSSSHNVVSLSEHEMAFRNEQQIINQLIDDPDAFVENPSIHGIIQRRKSIQQFGGLNFMSMRGQYNMRQQNPIEIIRPRNFVSDRQKSASNLNPVRQEQSQLEVGQNDIRRSPCWRGKNQQELQELDSGSKLQFAREVLLNNQRAKIFASQEFLDIEQNRSNQQVNENVSNLDVNTKKRSSGLNMQREESKSKSKDSDSDSIDYKVNNILSENEFQQQNSHNADVKEKSEQRFSRAISFEQPSNGRKLSQYGMIHQKSQALDLHKSLLLHVVQSHGDLEDANCNCQSKILIVDDNDFNVMTLVNVLKGIGQFKTEEAQNGKIGVQKFKEALNLPCNCKNRAYNLILMDIQMPVMDGYSATKEILALCKKSKYQCKIVALTSYTSDEVRQKCLALGMQAMYSKPVSSDTLKDIIKNYY